MVIYDIIREKYKSHLWHKIYLNKSLLWQD